MKGTRYNIEPRCTQRKMAKIRADRIYWSGFMKKLLPLTLTVLFLFGVDVETARAVPPPDFLFNLGSQIVQAFSVAALFLSAIVAAVSQFGKTFWVHIKHKGLVWGIAILGIVAVSYASASYYEKYRQDAEYEKWIKESEAQEEAAGDGMVDTTLDLLQLENEDGDAAASSEDAPPSQIATVSQPPAHNLHID